jgi:hypothetical protein
LKKKQEKEKPGVTRQANPATWLTQLQSVDFLFFLLKRRRFDLKKN